MATVLICAEPADLDGVTADLAVDFDIRLVASVDDLHAARGDAAMVCLLASSSSVAVDQAIRALAARGDIRETPILYLDLVGDGEARSRSLAAGCADAVGPPLTVDEIRHRIDVLLGLARERAVLLEANKTLRELADKKRVLAALVVHDLRNPLTAIQGNLQLVGECLPEEVMSDRVVSRAMNDLEDLATHTLSLVASLLDVEELEEGLLTAKPVDVDVGELLRRTSRHQSAVIDFRELSLDHDIAPELFATLDPTLVGRVVENLIDNGIRYAPKGGRVAVRAGRENGALVIRVLNSGPPVPVEKRETIFERFFQVEARREGVRANRGLGLYFCRLAADAHSGRIAATDGDAELPACFELTIPQ